MAEMLNISRAAFYAWKSRPESDRNLENKKILTEIKRIHGESKRRYGSPKIHVELRKTGIYCGLNRVARLMRENGIKLITRRKFKATTYSKHKHPVFCYVL